MRAETAMFLFTLIVLGIILSGALKGLGRMAAEIDRIAAQQAAAEARLNAIQGRNPAR